MKRVQRLTRMRCGELARVKTDLATGEQSTCPACGPTTWMALPTLEAPADRRTHPSAASGWASQIAPQADIIPFGVVSDETYYVGSVEEFRRFLGCETNYERAAEEIEAFFGPDEEDN